MTGSSTSDVVVIGGGGAGLAAAIEAARFGASVTLLEKNPALGGSTAWSVGSISITNSPHQRRQGIQDSPDEHFADLELLAGPLANRDNRVLRRMLVERTTETLEWLSAHGLVFVGPMPEPPHRYPRMHNVLPSSRAFPWHLSRSARRQGVDIRTRTAATRFLLDGDRVVGIEAQIADGSAHRFLARTGVVLASGDYSASPELKAELASKEAAALDAVNLTATGDGHRMAREIGAEIVNGDIVRGPIMRFVPPARQKLIQRLPPYTALARAIRLAMEVLPARVLRPFLMSFLTTALGPSPALFREGAILVNRAGQRFADELAKPAGLVPRQPGREAFIVMDNAIAQKFNAWPHFVSTAPGVAYAYLDDYRRNRRDIFHQAPSVADLARSAGIPPDALAQSVAAHNADARPRGRPALERPPFYALGPVRSYVVFTDGGLRVSERLEVLRAGGEVIPGLYAAGSAGQGGLLLEGHGHHLGWAFISGRIAGRHAALDARPLDARPSPGEEAEPSRPRETEPA
jgi:succinate dehydrogenase/fumarate reductase flavoprotein subunit